MLKFVLIAAALSVSIPAFGQDTTRSHGAKTIALPMSAATALCANWRVGSKQRELKQVQELSSGIAMTTVFGGLLAMSGAAQTNRAMMDGMKYRQADRACYSVSAKRLEPIMARITPEE